jgi:hypothetical protein
LSFVPYFVFVNFLDKSLLAGRSVGIMLIRFVALLVTSTLLAIFLDMMLFKKDILKSLSEREENGIEKVRIVYADSKKDTERKIEALGKRNAELTALITQNNKDKRVVGWAVNPEYESYRRNALKSLEQTAERYRKELADIETENKRLKADLFKQTAEFEKRQNDKREGIAEYGFIQYLKTYEKMIFESDDGLVKGFYFACFFLSLIVEALPFLFKTTKAYKEYMAIEEQIIRTNVDVNEVLHDTLAENLKTKTKNGTISAKEIADSIDELIHKISIEDVDDATIIV